jgi:outer membrane protein OmpA-like peptidoglycan-associated protein
MKTKKNFNNESCNARSYTRLAMKRIAFGALIPIVMGMAALPSTLQAQDAYTKPTWFFGAAVGANFNDYRGTTQQLNSDFISPTAFRHGKGVGLFLAPLVEYHKPDTRLGFMFQLGLDSRKGKFDRVISPCNCAADLKTNLRYFTIEPSLRFAPFKSSFYLYGGPRFAFNTAKSFTYSQKTNPDFAEQVAEPDVKGDFSNVNKTVVSMQIGAGYDLYLTSQDKRTQTVLSPFVSFQPYFGQSPRSSESWDLSTLRLGAAIKFGRGTKIQQNEKAELILPEVQFSVNSPTNIPVERRIRETFPLRNYIFFDLGSNEIPDRYVLLSKDQVKDFKEDQLEVFTPKRLSGRSAREMVVYYNVINIIGDRMGKNPDATILLVGSSQSGAADGTAMAVSVKSYLTSVFGISPSRIEIEGREKPKIPSEQPGGTVDLTLLREGDHRVSVESTSPALLMEFQSGPDAPLKPVEFSAVLTAPLDSYVTFNNVGATKAFTSWSLEIKDENGVVQNFGPYTQDKVSIPGKTILGTRPSGDYKVTMVGLGKNGMAVKKEASVHMVLWTPPTNEEGMRFSVIFEFNQSKTIKMYDKYLTEVVAPKIPRDASVIVHGHSDIIGDDQNNMELSEARANEVKNILQAALAKQGRKDVKFEVHGFGEDETLSPFENNFPEERFYNRTVIIDIIPRK